MSDTRVMIADAVERLLRDAATADATAVSDGWDGSLWAKLTEQGLPLLLVSEAQGGVGLGWEDALPVVSLLGAYGVALPIAETILAQRLLAVAGAPRANGAASFGPAEHGVVARGRFSGTLRAVPWGRQASRVVTVIESSNTLVVLDPKDAVEHTANVNLAGEPRDTLRFDDAAAQLVPFDPMALPEATDLRAYGALLRVGQIAGALGAALALTVDYARQRVQFGKPIGQFQAVQQQIATLASESAAVGTAANAAFRAAAQSNKERRDIASFEIAAAKIRASAAVHVGATIAHQMHGAIGFTHEYALRRLTHRLWSWRSEYGNDAYWSERLGGFVAARGPREFWSDLTSRG